MAGSLQPERERGQKSLSLTGSSARITCMSLFSRSHSSVGQSVRLITVRSAVQARVGAVSFFLLLQPFCARTCFENDSVWLSSLFAIRRAHGVVVSRLLRMQKALGSNPSGSTISVVAIKMTKYVGAKTNLRPPGIEPGAQAWEACMLPLHYERRRKKRRLATP